MRVAYLVHFRGGRETGIYRKVRDHVTEWSRRGTDVGLFVATDRAGASDWSAIPEAQRVEILPARPLLSIVARERLTLAVRRWRPDVVYARHGLAYPGFLLTARSFPTVLEINGDDLAEFRLASFWRRALARATRSLLLRSSAGLVFVSNELARSASFAKFQKPAVVVANGIDLQAHPPLPPPSNETPRLVFVGHPHSPWHGLEHLAELAGAFHSWQIDVVGPARDELSEAPGNIQFHGSLSPDAVAPLLARADVAIGTLGLYRKHMEEASPLKVREYLARGIPTILGYHDTDFPDSATFLLQVPNTPDGVRGSLAAIESFVDAARGTRVPRERVDHLDVTHKEAARLPFLERFATRSTVGE
jgi:hypothetical protein